ncbi:M48 family metallopeptidase [Allomuricauda sp. R78024]|uniref:M48 family metallopeptidase n=1 Tax=Allomuricauda sp. R78024 TaxID=3093867 RepID=UPI0037C6ADEC
MSQTKLILVIFLGLQVVTSQELPQSAIDEIVSDYQAKMEQATVLKDCGHAFDGPAFIIKQFENNWLDAMLLVTSDSKSTIGRDIYNQYKVLGKIDNGHSIYPKAEEILKNLTKYVNRKDVTYRLSILKSDEINAFATLGGYLYITTGLIDFVDSYDELAFIIGHEVAHEDKLHTQRKVTKLTLSADLSNRTRVQIFGDIAKGLNSTFSPPFDQIDEYESDKHGFELARNAGYDVNKFADFFKKLGKYQKQDLIKKLTSTHPFAEHRKKCIEQYIVNRQ